MPRGTVAFFAGPTTCPEDWGPATYTNGRLVVGAYVSDAGVASDLLETVGDPLADREDRAHAHTFSGTVSLAAQNLSGADGSNAAAAATGTVDVAGTTSPATTGLPFVQLMVCEKL